MNLERINITFTYEDLRLIEGIIRSGVKENGTNYFNNEHTLQSYLDDNFDNLEMLSDLCSFRGNDHLAHFLDGHSDSGNSYSCKHLVSHLAEFAHLGL